jgi:succinoglycan biosynthesis transport protein ExoP
MSPAGPASAVTTGVARDDAWPVAARPAVFGDVVRIAQKRFAFILLVTACVAIIAAMSASLIPVSYSSSAEILLDQHKNKIADLSTVVTDVPNDPVSTQNQIRVLTSRNLAAHVIEVVELARDPELNASASSLGGPAGTSSGAEDRIIDAFLQHLSVQPLGLSTTIAVTYTSRDPALASTVANTIAEEYLKHQIEANSQTAKAATAWLTQRVQKLAMDMQGADAAVQAYKRLHDLSEAADGTPLIDQELLAVQSQLMDAQATLAEKQATRQRLRALAASGSAPDISQVTASPVVVQLREQEADLLREEADMATHYGPKNPKIIAMESERKNIGDKIDGEINRTVAELDSDVAVLQAQVGTLQARLKETEHQATAENQARVELQSLEANAKSTRTAYESFVSRLRDVQGQDAMQVPDASIISRAPVPNTPSSPKGMLIVLGSIPAGFLLGLLLAMIRERGKAPSARPRVQVPLFAPLIARIPDLARQGLSSADIVDGAVENPSSPFARAIAALDAKVAAVRGQSAKVVGISSPFPGEGKTVVAISLARAAAQRGLRVLLIDGDAASGVTRTLRLAENRPGLSEVLAGRASLNQSVVRDLQSGAQILPAGQQAVGPHPPSMATRTMQLIGRLRGHCDLVIVDMPSANSAPDARALAAATDAVVLLVGWNGAGMPSASETNACCAAISSRNIGLAIAS